LYNFCNAHEADGVRTVGNVHDVGNAGDAEKLHEADDLRNVGNACDVSNVPKSRAAFAAVSLTSAWDLIEFSVDMRALRRAAVDVRSPGVVIL
jgi:hypothetical protein